MNIRDNSLEWLKWTQWDSTKKIDIYPKIEYTCPICLKCYKKTFPKCPNCGIKLFN